MKSTNLIQQARAKKQNNVVSSLKRAFNDFNYPMYLFGSYATVQFHGHSDTDIVIIAPDALSTKTYGQACNQIAGLDMNFDTLILPSIKQLDSRIVATLKTIKVPQPPSSASLYRNQIGMTLVEIMIALLIGAFLIGGVLEIFINSRQTYRMQEALSRLQENGRSAINFIGKDIRMTGYWGCLNPSSPDNDIAGIDNNAAVGDSIDDGTDRITLKGAFTQTVTGTCGTAVLTTAAYYTHASSTIIYTINNATLYQNTNNQNNSLVEGIENMQILYGVDTDLSGTAGYGTPNYYVPADLVTSNWPKVVSIRISLLAVTLDDNLTSQPVPYTYNSPTPTTPTDRKIRRVFNTTIAVRNRLP